MSSASQARLDELRMYAAAGAQCCADALLKGDLDKARRHAEYYAGIRDQANELWGQMLCDALTLARTERDLLEGP
jgi:hypothetical protein